MVYRPGVDVEKCTAVQGSARPGSGTEMRALVKFTVVRTPGDAQERARSG
jgi:hypothetical protein